MRVGFIPLTFFTVTVKEHFLLGSPTHMSFRLLSPCLLQKDQNPLGVLCSLPIKHKLQWQADADNPGIMKCQLGHLSWSLPISLCPRVRQAWKGNECTSFESQASGDSIDCPSTYPLFWSWLTVALSSIVLPVILLRVSIYSTYTPNSYQHPGLSSLNSSLLTLLSSTSPQLITLTVTAWALSGPNCSPSTGHFTPPPNKSSPLIFPRVPFQHHTWPQQAFDPTMHQASFPCSSPFLSS